MISQKINGLILSCCKEGTDCVLTNATVDKAVEAYACICCLLIAESTDQK
jgi:hypothetical protein